MSKKLVTVKIVHDNEIRRLSLPYDSITQVVLESKIRAMFPHLYDFACSYMCLETSFSSVIHNDEDLQKALNEALDKSPPLLRLYISPQERSEAEDLVEDLILEQAVEEEEEEEEEHAVEEEEQQQEEEETCCYCFRSIQNDEMRLRCLSCFKVQCSSCEGLDLEEPKQTCLFVKLQGPFASLTLKQKWMLVRNVEDPEEEVKLLKKTLKRMVKQERKNVRKNARRKKLRRKAVRRRKRQQEDLLNTVLPSVPVEDPFLEPFSEVVEDEVQDSLEPSLEVVDELVQIADQILESMQEKDQPQLDEQRQLIEEVPQESWGVMDAVTDVISAVDDQLLGLRGKADQLEAMGFTDKSKVMLLLAKNLGDVNATAIDLCS